LALTNYSELQSDIADWINRSDLSSKIPTFIALAEAQINRDVRHWRMETRSSGQQSAADEYMQLPADWVETIRLHVTDSGTSTVNLISRDAMADKRQGNNDSIQLYPTPSAETNLELLYYAKVPALSDSNTTNWLLTEAPDIYLYGSLLPSAPYLEEDERATTTWAQFYAAAVQQLNQASDQARYSGSGLRLKIRGLG